MKRGWGKKGQFYLIAAIILAVIIVSVAVISNYSKKQGQRDLNSLKDEIRIESAMVLDYAINAEETQPQVNSRIQDFTQRYIDSESRDKNLYFIFGKQDNVTLKGYQKNPHDVSLDGMPITDGSGEFARSIDPLGNSVTLQIDSDPYGFNLNSGENFYFVIVQEKEGGKSVVTG